MKLVKIILFLLISFNTPLKANSGDNVHSILNEGGKLIFIRHAYAPGGGDPDNFDISNCASQRNLNEEGIEQAKKIGKFFLEKNIIIDKILSSEWCRCKQIADYAFKNYETKSFLNSFFSQKFADNKDKQIKELKEYIENWNGSKNLILVTHYVVISELLSISASSGEIIISNKKYKTLLRIKN